MNGPGLTYSGMMSTPTIAPSTHSLIVWTVSSGGEPLPISRGGIWFIVETAPSPVTAPGQMKATTKIEKRPNDEGNPHIVAAEAVQWVRIKNSDYYMASMAITLAGTDVLSLDMGPNKKALDLVMLTSPDGNTDADVVPPGTPVHLDIENKAGTAQHYTTLKIGHPAFGHYWTLGSNFTTRLLGYTSTVTRADDPYAMVHFVPGQRPVDNA